MKYKCPAIIALLLIVIAGGTYKFIFQGSVSTSSDGRISILLNPGERDLVLLEMRTFLTSVQLITKGISENDMKLVSDAARAVGKAAQAQVPGTLIGKLPLEFKQLGFDTHSKFDQLAMDTNDLGDSQQILIQLSELMRNCVVCHATYRIDATQD
jgi:hypothetical protein